MNVYNLSRNFWNWAFENPDKIKPNHSALYFFAIEHCNRLGWKEKFGFPTSMAMEAIGIKSYNTFITTLKELVEYGFIKMIEKSKNQYSANIIALSFFDNACDKALDEALIKHTTKQSESTIQSTGESIDSIDKQTYNSTNLQTYSLEAEASKNLKKETTEESETVNRESEKEKKIAPKKEKFKPPNLQEVQEYCNERQNGIQAYTFINFYQSKGWKVGNQPMKDWRAAVRTWESKNKENGNNNTKSNSNGNTGGSPQISGKITATSILAGRIKSAGNSESGNITIDAEIVE